MSRNIKLLRCPGTPSVPNVLRHDIQDSGWSPGGLEPRGNWSPGDLESRGRGGGAPGRSWQILWGIVANAPDHDGGPAGGAVSRCLLPGGCSRFVGSLQPVIAPCANVTARARAQPGTSAAPPDRAQGLLLAARGSFRTRLGWLA